MSYCRERRAASRLGGLAFLLLATAAGLAAEPRAAGAGRRVACPFESGVWREMEIPAAREKVVAAKKQAWEDARGGQEAARPHVRARLAALPRYGAVEPLPRDDEAFARRLASDTWRGLAALTDRENGLPVDNVRFVAAADGRRELRVGDYASGTDIGLHLMAVVAARDLRLITAAEAATRLRTVLDTVSRLETHRGFLFNYYDTTSLERTSHFVSFVDASWLTAGLMVVRQAVPELRDAATRLIAREDFGFFYDRAGGRISHGFYVNAGARSPYDYGLLFSEARLGSLIAIGKGDVPEAHWFHMVRTFPPDCAGQSMQPRASRVDTVRGHPVTTGYYEWNGVRFVPSWGGSMFEALMPVLVLDEWRHAPRSLGANDRAHVEVQRRYAAEVLGYDVWGLSPCAVPGAAADGTYGEYGVKVLGTRGYVPGAVAPYASALALAVDPAAARRNLRTLAERYEVYGDFGFYDAVDPHTKAVAPAYLALDQSMLFLALANHLADRCVQKWFQGDPIARRALPVLAGEDFFGDGAARR